MALKGTPAERREQKALQRRDNQVKHVTTSARQAKGHQLVVVACNAALAVSRRSGPEAQQRLARSLAEVIERFDNPEISKEQS